MANLRVGEVLDGRFRLESCLGHGAFGEVWKATDLRLEPRTVAVKFLRTYVQTEPGLIERFNMEARALSVLSHPNIVSIVDRGEDGGRHYIIMEYLRGGTLAAWLQDHQSRDAWPDLDLALSVFDQIAAAVQAAHSVTKPGPIIHRDLKPANIFLTPGDHFSDLHVRVVDFGLAQLGGRLLTPTGMMLGTPAYMAPEQAFGDPTAISPASDVFSLGVILIELLTLEMASPSQMPWWVEVTCPSGLGLDTLSKMRSDLPKSIWQIASLALKTRPSERYKDAGEMRRAVKTARHEILKTNRKAPRVAMGRLDQLRLLEQEVDRCRQCPLGSLRQTPAFSRGTIPAKVMFIGEAPGAEEDRTGMTLSGPAGQLLDRMIAAMELTLDDVYLTDVVKCRTPDCRNPEPQELAACRVHWKQQVEIVKPRVIVALGRIATEQILGLDRWTTEVRGKWAKHAGIPILPTYHPAYLLRKPDAKEESWLHLKMVMELLKKA